MNRWLAWTTLLVLVCSVALLPASPAQAQSIGLSPGSVEVVDSLRGAEYTRQFRLINQLDVAQTYDLVLAGDAVSWMTLYDAADRTVQVDRIVSEPGTGFRVVVQITIPDDAANGRHVTEISMQPVATDGDDPSVRTGLALDVTIDVTGTQRLEGIVSATSVPDTEVGLPLRATLEFLNTGNVFAEPEVQLLLVDSVGDLVDGVTKTHDLVAIESSATLKTELDTANPLREPGLYNVGVLVHLAEDEIYTEQIDIQIWPEGHFTRVGELERLELTNAPDPGAAARIEARFRNTGQVDTLAQFKGEVYRDDVLISAAESSELLVETGSLTLLSVVVPVEERGEYRVEGVVNFEGKETNSESISFDVPTDSGSGGLPFWQVVVGILVAAIVVSAVAIEGGRRWREYTQEADS